MFRQVVLSESTPLTQAIAPFNVGENSHSPQALAWGERRVDKLLTVSTVYPQHTKRDFEMTWKPFKTVADIRHALTPG